MKTKYSHLFAIAEAPLFTIVVATGSCNPHYLMGEMQLNWKLNVHPLTHTAVPACARLSKDEQPFAALTFKMCAA